MVLKNALTNFWREIHEREGYVEIATPIMLNRSLWETSGHWDHYKENMYTTCLLYTSVFMHKYTGSGAAHLPLIEQNSQLQSVHRHIPFTVREENISRFAPQLQRGRYQFLRSRASYLAAHLG